MESVAVLAQLYCLVFASGPPDFYLSEYRKKLICKSAPQVIEQAREVDIEPSLVMALISVESNWNRTVVSSANACGLTQVIPKYTGKITKKYTCKQLQIPRNSIYVGIKTLKYWIDWHAKNQPEDKYTDLEILKRGLCSYNAGYRCGPNRRPIRAGMRYAKKVLDVQKMINGHVIKNKTQ